MLQPAVPMMTAPGRSPALPLREATIVYVPHCDGFDLPPPPLVVGVYVRCVFTYDYRRRY